MAVLKKALASSGVVLAVAGAGTSAGLEEVPLGELFTEAPTPHATLVGEDGVTRYRTIITYKQPPTEAQLDSLDSLPERVEETGPRKLLNFLPGDPIPKSTSGALTHSWHIIPGAAALLTEDELRELSKDPSVKNVHFEVELKPENVENQWQIGARSPRVYGQTGSGVKLCTLSAIDPNPYLPPLTKGYSPYPPNNGRPIPGEQSAHETFMTSEIASQHPIYRGIAPGVQILAYNAFIPGGSEATIIDGVEWCVENGGRVLAYSVGGGVHTEYCDDLPLPAAFNAAFASGVVVVKSSGNTAQTDGVSYPGCASKVLAVTGNDRFNEHIDSLNAWSKLSFTAPGGDLFTPTGRGERITGGGGTSFAAPIVAGVAALVTGADPTLTSAEVVAIMSGTALDLGPPGRDSEYGWGLVQAQAAVRRAMTGAGLPDPGAHDAVFWPYVVSSTDFTANWTETGGGGWRYAAGSWTDKPTGGDALYDNFPRKLYQTDPADGGFPVANSFRLDNCPTECTITHTAADLSSVSGAMLRFFTGIDDALDRDDYLIVEARDDTGAWRKIFTGSGGQNNTNVTIINYKVLSGAYMHSNFTIRVRGSIDKYNEEAYFDSATLIEWPVD